MAAVGALSACTHTKATGLGNRNAPNEFAVTRQPPLVIPPDFALRPQRPGAPRPQEVGASAQALAVMFGGAAVTSPGQDALIGAAGGTPDAGVRSGAGDPDTAVVDKGTTTKDILSAPTGSTDAATATTTPQ
ncbi:MAG TPA: DUF3035 domain-containing protein [Sphingomonas sp.]